LVAPDFADAWIGLLPRRKKLAGFMIGLTARCDQPSKVVVTGEVAQSQQAKMGTARSDKHGAASGVIRANGWFTEGFDTRDLKEAKALLDELRA
jgi:hypothetical protein